MLGRWTIVGVLAGAVLAVPLAAEAQRSGAVPRIGFLGIDSSLQAERLAAFKDGLRDFGYVEGRNITIEYRWAEGRFDRLPQLATELVDLHVDVIVTAAHGVRAAQGATKRIPIVIAAVAEPVKLGFAASLALPGGNITGMAFQDIELDSKRLTLLRDVVPGLTRLAAIWNPEGAAPSALRAVEDAARALNIQVLVLEVRAGSDLENAVSAAKKWGAQALIEVPSAFFSVHLKTFTELLKTHKLPATCEARNYVEAGCLMFYGASLEAMFRRSAYYVDRILKGADPANLPIEQPREFAFVINLKTAESLGLTVPSMVRLQATEVIE